MSVILSSSTVAARESSPLPDLSSDTLFLFAYLLHFPFFMYSLVLFRLENITLWRTKDAIGNRSLKGYNSGLVQAVIFEASDRNNIGGSAYGGQRSICCTPDVAKLQGCKQGKHLSAKMEDTEILIKKTGIYNLLFISCDLRLKGLKMTVKTVWKTPEGYLLGRMAPLMKFYVYISLAYLLLSAVWFV